MKNGVLTYSNYNNKFNIGDYLQSLAALQFLDKPVEYLNREMLDEYNGEDVRLIMNGWFLHECKHWPPSNKIFPVFISFHLNSVAYEILDSKKTIDYFKKHEPIGCRDKKTMNLLRGKGVDSYFSGCLTLTLGAKYMYKGNRNNEIVFVDPYYEYNKDIKSLFFYTVELIKNYSIIKKITRQMFDFVSLKKIHRTAAFYYGYKKIFSENILKKAKYFSHLVDASNFKNEEEKFLYAENLISKYSRAKMVITSKIHCALPCLSLETPVLYTNASIHEQTSSCRLDGLIELFNSIQIGPKKVVFELLKKKEKIDEKFFFKNKNDYKILKDNLLKSMSRVMDSKSL